jgi:hypothetical protein
MLRDKVPELHKIYLNEHIKKADFQHLNIHRIHWQQLEYE